MYLDGSPLDKLGKYFASGLHALVVVGRNQHPRNAPIIDYFEFGWQFCILDASSDTCVNLSTGSDPCEARVG